jgi:hypothetical protein
MNLVALLSWFDEPVADLVACIASLREAGVDELVALDGRYALYRADSDVSPSDQYAAIVLACRQVGMGCTIHAPREAWAGNEVEKRTFLFALGWSVAKPGDWFWVMDADQVVTKVPEDLKARLAATEMDAAEVQFLDVVALRANRKDWPPHFAVRDLFRAQSIHLETNHVTYVTADGRYLWCRDDEHDAEPVLDLTDCVLVEHRPDRRPTERQLAKMNYYADRDASGVERGACRCGQRSAGLVPVNWRWTDIGPVADWREACDRCAKRLDKVARRELVAMGVDPASVRVENRNGHAPPVAAHT